MSFVKHLNMYFPVTTIYSEIVARTLIYLMRHHHVSSCVYISSPRYWYLYLNILRKFNTIKRLKSTFSFRSTALKIHISCKDFLYPIHFKFNIIVILSSLTDIFLLGMSYFLYLNNEHNKFS